MVNHMLAPKLLPGTYIHTIIPNHISLAEVYHMTKTPSERGNEYLET